MKPILHPTPYHRGKVRRIYWKRTTGTLIYLLSFEGRGALLWTLRIPGEEWAEPVYHRPWQALAARLDRAPLLDLLAADGYPIRHNTR